MMRYNQCHKHGVQSLHQLIITHHQFNNASLSSLSLSSLIQLSTKSMLLGRSAKYATAATTNIQGTQIFPTVPKDSTKKRIAVLGSGWGGFTLLKFLDRSKFDVICVSPRNHFLFTPLLASTAVGTLEFRCIIEPVRTLPHIHYYQANCQNIDTQSNTIDCIDTFKPDQHFSIPYDYLVIACGSRNNTFNTPGVDQYAFPLKNLWDSRSVRSKLLENFERAASITATPQEREQYSTVVIVGGGPTSIEFSGELWDFLQEDVRKWYPEIKPKIFIAEVGDHILSTFDESLSGYAESLLKNRKEIKILTHTRVVEVTAESVTLGDGSTIPTALVVWNTGIMQNDFVKSLPFQKGRKGGILVNEFLQVKDSNSQVIPNLFCLGDCSNYGDNPLPATAQVASQEARWLATFFNKANLARFPILSTALTTANGKPFHFHNLGVLAYIGGWRALAQLNSTNVSGFKAWIVWRSAYLTNLLSWKNRFLVAMFWFKSYVFGRDISRF